MTVIQIFEAIPMHYMLQFRENPDERAKPKDPAKAGATGAAGRPIWARLRNPGS